MSSDLGLRNFTLGELVELSQGLAINSKTKHLLASEGLPLLRITDLINDEQVQFIKKDSAPSKCIATVNDIIYTRTGQVGLVFKGKTGVIHNNCFKVIPNTDLLDSDYLYWLLSQDSIKKYANDVASGSVQKDLNHSAFKSISIDLPTLDYQKTVGPILNSLSQKIELNRQTNQTLEQIAQALFKSWFVDFEPTRAKIFAKEASASPEEIERAAMCAISGKTPDQLDQLPPETQQNLKTTAALFPDALMDSELGEVPEGWEIGTLGDLMSFNPQRTLRKGTFAPYLDMKNVPTEGHLADDVYLREMGSGMKFINGDTLLARITPCLENGKTAYVDFLEEGQVGWGSTEFIVMRPKEGRPLSLGYIIARLEVFRSKAIQTMTGSSGRQRADANVLSQQPWINYPIALLKKFDLTSGYFLAIAKNNGEQNKALSELRDSLLPKLLSGEISLNDVHEELK